MATNPRAITPQARRNSIGFTSFRSHNDTAHPTSATGMPNQILNRRSAFGRLYRSQITARHVETYWRMTAKFARLTRLLKLKPSAAQAVNAVVRRIATDGVLYRGCGAAIPAGRCLSSATADRKRGQPRALPALKPTIEMTAPIMIKFPPADPMNCLAASTRACGPTLAKPG